jgi:aspartyl-tRNA(Asn)/glutamyl-tRNA(Gln) amidotransferase subunit C
MDRKQLKDIAQLSRISLTDHELDEFTPQMETILNSAKLLQTVDVSTVQPMKKQIPFSSLREDVVSDSLSTDLVLKNAKHSKNGFVLIYGKVFGDIEES